MSGENPSIFRILTEVCRMATGRGVERSTDQGRRTLNGSDNLYARMSRDKLDGNLVLAISDIGGETDFDQIHQMSLNSLSVGARSPKDLAKIARSRGLTQTVNLPFTNGDYKTVVTVLCSEHTAETLASASQREINHWLTVRRSMSAEKGGFVGNEYVPVEQVMNTGASLIKQEMLKMRDPQRSGKGSSSDPIHSEDVRYY